MFQQNQKVDNTRKSQDGGVTLIRHSMFRFLDYQRFNAESWKKGNVEQVLLIPSSGCFTTNGY
ncbi:MAG: hypothetical protein HRT38_17440 [Alteromonadaceae bacterium]|nr:hypothetical protein [Alteromonadaceae bacterium]